MAELPIIRGALPKSLQDVMGYGADVRAATEDDMALPANPPPRNAITAIPPSSLPTISALPDVMEKRSNKSIVDIENIRIGRWSQKDNDMRLPPAQILSGVEEDKIPEPVDTSRILGAAFRQSNLIGSFLATKALTRPEEEVVEPGYDMWNDIKDTKYASHLDRFAHVFNKRAADALKAQIDMEERDRGLLNSAGFAGGAASLLAGVLDVPTLFPAGRVYSGVRAGEALLKSGASTGVWGGIAAGTQAAGLYATQATKEPIEIPFAIGGGVLLGALLGTGGASVLRAVGVAEARRMARQLDDFTSGKTMEPPVAPAIVQAENDLRERILAGKVSDEEIASINAAYVAGPTREGEKLAGAAQKAAESTGFVSFNTASVASPNKVIAGSRIPNVSLYRNKNLAGIPTDPDIENMVTFWRGKGYNAIDQLRQAWKEYRQGGGKLTWNEFDEEAAKAMRRGDKSGIPIIDKTIAAIRKGVFDETADEAIYEGLLNESDLLVKTADSYLHKVGNSEKIIREEFQYRDAIRPWIEKVTKARIDEITKNKNARVAALEQVISDLSANYEETVKLLESLPEDIKALEARFPQHVATSKSLTPLFSSAVKLKEAGDIAGSLAARKQIRDIVTSAGEDYADFVTSRNLLRSRLSNLRRNIVSSEIATEKLRARIIDAENSNIQRLDAMHKSLVKLQSEMSGLDDAAISARLSDLRSEFAEIQNKSIKAQEDFAAKRQKLQDELKALDAMPAEKRPPGAEARAAAIQKELDTPDPFVAEARREDALNKLADDISDIEKIDTAAAAEELNNLIEKRIAIAAARVEDEARRITAMAERIKTRDPKLVEEKVNRIKAAIRDRERRYNDTMDVGYGINDPGGLDNYIKEVEDWVVNQRTGRGKGGGGVRFTPMERGPLAKRMIPIPDVVEEPWLINSLEEIIRRYSRQTSADLVLKKVFGSIDAKEHFAAVDREWDNLRRRVGSGPRANERVAGKSWDAATQLSNINKLQQRWRAQAEAILEEFRGLGYNTDSDSGLARVLNAAGTATYVARFGGILSAAIGDPFRAALYHGLKDYLSDGVMPFISGLKKAGKGLSVADAKYLGLIIQKIENGRLAMAMGITDPLSRRTPIENFLNFLSQKVTKFSGITSWDDSMRKIAYMSFAKKAIDYTTNFSKATQKQRAWLAYVGIGPEQAQAISEQLAKHGRIVDGIKIANVEDWGKGEVGSALRRAKYAQQAYAAAASRDVLGSAPGHISMGDVPQMSKTPAGRLMFMGQKFNLASHNKIFLRALQESPSNVISFLTGSVITGMMIYYLKAVENNTVSKLSDNPGEWIKQGIDRTSIIPMLSIVNSLFGQATGFDPMGGTLRSLFPNKSQEFPHRLSGIAGAMLGPPGDFADSIQQVLIGLGSIKNINKRTGDERGLTESEKRAIVGLMPGATLPVIKEILSYGVMPSWVGK